MRSDLVALASARIYSAGTANHCTKKVIFHWGNGFCIIVSVKVSC